LQILVIRRSDSKFESPNEIGESKKKLLFNKRMVSFHEESSLQKI
jgi:hypothetical protein